MRNEGLTDARLRELYRRALDARTARGRERCIAPEAILAVLRREGAEEQRLEAIDHVMGCAGCRSEFDLLRSIEEAGAESVRPVSALPRIFFSPKWRAVAPFALAASIVLVVAVGLRPRSETRDVERGMANDVVLLGPAPEVDAGSPLAFAWRPVPGARSYDLEVLDEQGAVVFSERTAATSVTLSDARRLTPGASYRWWVRATTASGAPLASEVRSLRIRRK